MSSTRKIDLSKTDPSLSLSPPYQTLLESLRKSVKNAQVKAALAVNQELVVLYYDLGRQILEQQEKEGWGNGVIDRLAKDLRREFPEVPGFSPRNLGYMKSFASAYPADSKAYPFLSKIPWSHHTEILDSVKESEARLFYIKETIKQGFSKRVLAIQIDSQLYQRQGKAITNFDRTLPSPQSELAQEVFKNPYDFHFLPVYQDAKELKIEKSLSESVEKFLLELGVGFSFMGRQYYLKVADQDYYLDMLFYHVNLRCFVIVELKTRAFKPEDAGKMGFYLTAVDNQLRHETDNPTIGLILCRNQNKLIVEYALQPINQPIGVSTYKLQILEALPKEWQGQLPTVEEFETELKNIEDLKNKQES